MATSAEDRMVKALDSKARIERGLDEEEVMAAMIVGGFIPPNEDMSRSQAHKVYDAALQRLIATNIYTTIYQHSLSDHSIAQMAAAYPYVLKKKAEDVNVNVDIDPMAGMSEADKKALKEFTKTMLKRQLGMEE